MTKRQHSLMLADNTTSPVKGLLPINAMTDFLPPAALRNPHIQSILASSKLRKLLKRGQYRAMLAASQTVVLDCGEGVQLLGDYSAQPGRSKGLAILIHGWEGSSNSSYLLSLAGQLYRAGFAVFRLNLRDHGDSHHLNRELFHSTRLDEVLNAVAAIQRNYPHHRNFLAGFSLGGNFAMRVAANAERAGIQLDQTVAICPVLDPVKTMHALEQGWWVYEKYFIRKWRRSLSKKMALFPELAAGKQMLAGKTLRAMNQHFVPHHTPYRELESYLSSYTLLGGTLNSLTSPARIITAQDDPMILAEDLPRLPDNQFLSIETPRYGGHCGFIANYTLDSWIDQRVLEVFTQARQKTLQPSAQTA